MTAAHLSILLLSLLGFSALALATERYGEHLLGRLPALRWRRLARVVGWLLLAAALALGMEALGGSIGLTLWLGWLTVAALVLVFSLPKWPWQPPRRHAPARKPRAEPEAPAPRRHPGRWVAAGLVAATALVFGGSLLAVEGEPLARDEALRGSAGPWTFVLAEAEPAPPEVVDMGVPLKAFRLRFCEACDLDIRHAYLKVNKPRAMRAAGMAFEGGRWQRSVEIQLPDTLRADSELWLTVVGKDGAVHQVSWRMDQVSPATVAWFEQRRSAHAAP